MSKKISLVLAVMAGVCIMPMAFAQLFSAKAPDADSHFKPGINKVPPLMPVMSPGDFQKQVKSLSDENRKAMTQQGLNTIQQQRDALPATKPSDPPPLPEKNKTSPETGQASGTAPQETPAAAPPPATPEPSASSNDENAAPTETPQNYTGFSNNSSSPAGGGTSSSGSGGQLNIQY